MKYAAILIADVYQEVKEAERTGRQIELDREAESLSLLSRAYGRNSRRVAIVPEHHLQAQAAYQRAGFTLIPMNGNRPQAILKFVTKEMGCLDEEPAERLVLVGTDAVFAPLCAKAEQKRAAVSVWATGDSCDPVLNRSGYDCRKLDELLSGFPVRQPRVVVFLDYENLHITLEKIGISPNPAVLVQTVKDAVADIGQIVEIRAYAVWKQLSSLRPELDLQEELTQLGVRTVYLSSHGKNSADMVIANDLRTWIERDASAFDAADQIVLGSGDNDFTPVLETAQARGKPVTVLGFSHNLGRTLSQSAQVRYLDPYLNLPAPLACTRPTNPSEFGWLLKLASHLAERRWHWIYLDTLSTWLNQEGAPASLCSQLMEAGLLKSGDQRGTVQINQDHPDAFLAGWLVRKLHYFLHIRKLEYITTGLIAKAMSSEEDFRRLGIGQSWENASELLSQAARSGLLAQTELPRPDRPGCTLKAWNLA